MVGFALETVHFSLLYVLSFVLFLSTPLEVMNYQKPPLGNPFFKDDEPGITCKCWQECTRTEYTVEVAPNMLR